MAVASGSNPILTATKHSYLLCYVEAQQSEPISHGEPKTHATQYVYTPYCMWFWVPTFSRNNQLHKGRGKLTSDGANPCKLMIIVEYAAFKNTDQTVWSAITLGMKFHHAPSKS